MERGLASFTFKVGTGHLSRTHHLIQLRCAAKNNWMTLLIQCNHNAGKRLHYPLLPRPHRPHHIVRFCGCVPLSCLAVVFADDPNNRSSGFPSAPSVDDDDGFVAGIVPSVVSSDGVNTVEGG